MPIAKVLVAYDGSEGACAALDDLARAALPDAIDARVVAVASDDIPQLVEVATPEDGGDEGPGPVRIRKRIEDAMQRAGAVAEEAAALLAQRFPRWRVDTRPLRGSPASAIVLEADTWGADLVVVGSRGRLRAARFLLGSVARKVVTEARCSVRVARPSDTGAVAPARILVGHDGRPAGREALAAAAARAWPAGTEVRVVAVEDGYAVASLGAEGPSVYVEGATAMFRHAIETDAERATRTGLAVTASFEFGDPMSTLLRIARKWPADCVFVGAVDRGRMDRFLLGSVSAAVADRAACSVEVVRARRA